MKSLGTAQIGLVLLFGKPLYPKCLILVKGHFTKVVFCKMTVNNSLRCSRQAKQNDNTRWRREESPDICSGLCFVVTG